MKKLFKFLFVAVGLLVVLGIAAVIVASVLIDPNDYKDDIVQAVKTRTGRTLDLKGDIKLSFFPWLGLELGETRLSNAAGFGKKPMASIDRVEVQLKVLPLLRKEVEVATIVLDGLQLNLAKNRKGVSNWDDIVARTTSKPGTKPKAKKPVTSAAPLAAFSIGGIDIRRGQLHWFDASSGTDVLIRNLRLHTGKLANGIPMRVRLGFDLETGKPVIHTPFDMAGEVTVNIDKQTLDVKQLQLSLLELDMTANLSGSRIIDSPRIKGQFSLQPANLRGVLNQLGIEPDMHKNALQSVSLGTNFSFDQATGIAAVDKLTAKLDNSTLNGNASYKLSKVPAIRAAIAVDTIDADLYLPQSRTAKANDEGRAAPLVIPVEPLRTLDLQASFKLDSLKLMGIRTDKIEIPIKAKDGLVKVGPSRAQMYGGKYLGTQTLDVRKGAPRITSSEKLTNVQVGGLLKDMDLFDKFSGVGNVSADITTRGSDLDDILNTLNGKANVSLKNGSLSGINIYETINNKCRALQKPGATPAPQESKEKSTHFADLNTSVLITNGVVSNKDLLVKGKLLTVSGKGQVDLPKKRIDYLANVNLLGETTCWTSKFPLVVKGPFKKLSFTKILGDSVSFEWKRKVEQDLKKAAQKELKKKLGIPENKTSPTAPTKSPEELLKEKLKQDAEKKLKELLKR